MTRQQRFAAVAIALLGATAGVSAFAQEATSDAWRDAALTKTRAQVQGELVQARLDGTIKAGSAGYIEPLKSSRSRAEVRAEVAVAQASGELAAINAEVYGYQPAPTVRLAQAAR